MIKMPIGCFLFSPLEPTAGGQAMLKQRIEKRNEELEASVEELKKLNSDLHEARRAAFNLLEDAVQSKEALEINEERMHKLKEAFQSVVKGASLKDSLNILTQLAIKETAGLARTAFYMANKAGTELHTIRGAGNMPVEYANEIDAFLMGFDSLACGLAVPAGERVTTTDVREEPLWKPLLHVAEKYNYRGCWSFPIKTKDDKIGTFALYFEAPREVTLKEIELAGLITQAAAVIITNHNESVQRLRAEEALQQSEEKLRQLNTSLEQKVVSRTADLIEQHTLLKQAEEIAEAGSWHYNVKTKEFLWSDGMYRLFDMKKSEPITPGVYLKYSVKDDMPIAKKIVDAIQNTFEPFEETMRIKFDSSYRTVRIKAAPLQNEKGEVEKMLGVDLDITNIQQSEERIVALNRSLSAMNNSLRSMNSELKNFNTIAANNYAETLRHVYINLETIVTTDARNLSNSSRANLRRAQAAIQKMKLLTNDINNYLELYDIEIHKELIDPANVLFDVKEKMQKKIEDSNTTINIATLPQLFADPLLFSKLMHSIIDNSIKFRKTDVDPVININYSLVAEMNSNPKAVKNTAYTIISIKDNGTGFKDSEAENIFELFTQLEDSKHKGSGIGLAICKKIMEMHGGFIVAESEVDKGTSIHCYFPS